LCNRVRAHSPGSLTQIRDERGVLSVGAVADIVLFDRATVIDNADFGAPPQAPTGIGSAIVGGVVVLADDVIGQERPGPVLRRAG
jgi:N-acyl-D-aspartate/D-glutamate deacylase